MGKIQMQLYENGLDKIKRLERALRAVTEEGVPVTTACTRENLQYEWFRRFVSQDIDADRDGQKTAVTVTWDNWSTWQEQLLCNMVGEITPVPKGFDEIYRKITTECLSKEERDVIRLKYEEMLSLEEVAAQMGMTANKVRHILAAALRKLRNPCLRWQLCLGADYTKALQEMHTAQTEYDQAILRKEEELDRTIREKVRELQARTQELQAKTRELDEQPLEDALRCKLRKIPLEHLELSTRAYNVIRRYCAQNRLPWTAETVALLHGKLDELQGLGTTSKRDIIMAMRQLGVDMET